MRIFQVHFILSNKGKELLDGKFILDVVAKDVENLVDILVKDLSISDRLAILVQGNMEFDLYEPVKISEFSMRKRYGNEPLEVDRDKEPISIWTDENFMP